ncbi:MAG: hypothetical protein QOF84_1959, partial [Streptomyces sp.]|nr:hypothetical protein [Streptomyces sp.]
MAIRLLTLLSSLDPGSLHLRRAAQTLAAALAALLLTGGAGLGLGGRLAVVSVVVAVTAARILRGFTARQRAAALVHVPVAGAVVAVIGAFMALHAALGAVLFVAAVFAARWLIGGSGRARRFGRLALSPLLAMFVVPLPPQAVSAPGPLWPLRVAAACAIAVACVWAAHSCVLPDHPARDSAAAARAFLRLARQGSGVRALHRAALALDDPAPAARPLTTALLQAESLYEADPADERLPAVLLRAEALAAELARGTDPPGAATATGASADAERVARAGSAGGVMSRADPPAGPELPVRPPPVAGASGRPDSAPRARSRAGLSPHTRLAAQLATAMGLAFASGHLLFPQRWNWPVITAFVVCGAARSRGDVVHRSALRVLGALSGALTATPVAYALRGHAGASVAVIFGYLFVGLWLRDLAYTAWAFCVTSLLAVLYALHGDSGTAALLVERPAGILLGSACGIAAAFFVLPIRTERVIRARTAAALRAL